MDPEIIDFQSPALILEDRENPRQAIKDILESKDVLESRPLFAAGVHMAQTAKEGLELFQEYNCRFVTIDHELSDEDGIYFLGEVKDIKDIYAVLITGKANDKEKQQYRELGIREIYDKDTNWLPKLRLDLLWQKFLSENEGVYFPATPDFIEHKEYVFDDPFSLDYQVYKTFNAYERVVFQVRARNIYRSFIDENLEKENADWILVVGGEVIGSSSSPSERPTNEKLTRIASEKKRFPFIFSRFRQPPPIEELGGSAWTKTGIDPMSHELLPGGQEDYYPTVRMIIGSKDWDDDRVKRDGIIVKADTDTGNPYTLVLDLEELKRARWFNDEYESAALQISETPYPYPRYPFYPILHELKVLIKDVYGNVKSKDFLCGFAPDFAILRGRYYPNRQAFAGRGFVTSFPLMLLFDGSGKETYTILLPSCPERIRRLEIDCQQNPHLMDRITNLICFKSINFPQCCINANLISYTFEANDREAEEIEQRTRTTLKRELGKNYNKITIRLISHKGDWDFSELKCPNQHLL